MEVRKRQRSEVSGKVKWAPAICRKTGTEWLYRLDSELKRWRRQLALPKFFWLLLRYRLGKNRGKLQADETFFNDYRCRLAGGDFSGSRFPGA